MFFSCGQCVWSCTFAFFDHLHLDWFFGIIISRMYTSWFTPADDCVVYVHEVRRAHFRSWFVRCDAFGIVEQDVVGVCVPCCLEYPIQFMGTVADWVIVEHERLVGLL